MKNSWELLESLFVEEKEDDSLVESVVWRAVIEAVGDPSSDERDEFIDYDPTQMHPALVKKREELKKVVDWMAVGLDKDGTPEMKRVAAQLKSASDLPADQIPAVLSRAHDVLFKANRTLRSVNPAQNRDLQNKMKTQSAAIQDVLKAFPTALSTAAAIGRSQKSDKGLWKKDPKGYVDHDTGEFKRKGSVTYPTGVNPREFKPGTESEPPNKSVGPVIRKAGTTEPEKQPVKPKWDPKKIGVTVRKKGETK
jgi:hypothetical protein